MLKSVLNRCMHNAPEVHERDAILPDEKFVLILGEQAWNCIDCLALEGKKIRARATNQHEKRETEKSNAVGYPPYRRCEACHDVVPIHHFLEPPSMRGTFTHLYCRARRTVPSLVEPPLALLLKHPNNQEQNRITIQHQEVARTLRHYVPETPPPATELPPAPTIQHPTQAGTPTRELTLNTQDVVNRLANTLGVSDVTETEAAVSIIQRARDNVVPTPPQFIVEPKSASENRTEYNAYATQFPPVVRNKTGVSRPMSEAQRQQVAENNDRKRRAVDSGWFMAAVKQQDNKCFYCDHPFTKMPDIDHDHVTGALRCLAHSFCNKIVGLAREDWELLMVIAEHLKELKGA